MYSLSFRPIFFLHFLLLNHNIEKSNALNVITNHKERINMATIGTVVLLTGKAIIVDAQGAQHALKLGETIQPGDTIIVPKGAMVELQLVMAAKCKLPRSKRWLLVKMLAMPF